MPDVLMSCCSAKLSFSLLSCLANRDLVHHEEGAVHIIGAFWQQQSNEVTQLRSMKALRPQHTGGQEEETETMPQALAQ